MSCPCGLSRTEVLEVAEKHGVPLVAGRCQNPLADGTDGICGKALGAHPLSPGNHILSTCKLNQESDSFRFLFYLNW